MPPTDRLPASLVVFGWGLAALASGVALWNGDAALKVARRNLLRAETAAAASALTDPDGPDRVARALQGRWARSAIVRPDVTAVEVAEGEEGLVGRAPVRDAAGRNAGTLAVLERRDLPRGLPPWLLWASAASLALLLALSIASVRRGRHVLVWLLAAAAALAPATLTCRWASGEVDRTEVAREAALRTEATASRVDPTGASNAGDTSRVGAPALAARTLGPGLLGVSAWLVLASIASPRRARRIR
jgi:hypothetical protein